MEETIKELQHMLLRIYKAPLGSMYGELRRDKDIKTLRDAITALSRMESANV